MSDNGHIVTLSPETAAHAQQRAKSLGFAHVDEYLSMLVAQEASADEHDYGAPNDLTVRSREQLEQLVAEGMTSPSRPITAADWEEMRQRLRRRHTGKAH